MRTYLFILSSTVAILILLYHDSQQSPTPPSYSYARAGVGLVGQAQADASKLPQAEALLYEALRMDEHDPLALFGMGWALQSKRWNGEAERYYAKAMHELDELQKYSHYNLSLLLEEKGDLKGALAEVEKSILIGGDNFQAAIAKRTILLAKLNAPPPPGRATIE